MKKQTKPRKPTRTQQLELDTAELSRALEVSRNSANDLSNKYYKVSSDLDIARSKNNTLEGELRGLKVSITNVESKYMEQKGRADALELALRFAQKVPEKSEKQVLSNKSEAAQAKEVADAASYLNYLYGGTPRRPY